MDDLSCWSFVAGQLGMLQTLKRYYVVAGDWHKIDIDLVLRKQPLRQFIMRDARFDIGVFFVPMRHIHGDDWIEFIKAGADESVTLGGATTTTVGSAYMGHPLNAGVMPLRNVKGYARIWNRWYRNQTDDGALMSETLPLQDDLERIYGKHCARLPSIWSTSIDSDFVASDREIDVSGGTLDLADLVYQSGEYETRQKIDFYGREYQDIMASRFGGTAGTDADERPTLLWHEKGWLSGYDVDGTDSASLGDFVGKAVGRMRVNMPRRWFGEHGMIWIMGLMRYPTINGNEFHYLDLQVDPTYHDIAGDMSLLAASAPRTHAAQDFFVNGTSAVIGTFPDGQWYRSEPSYVHQNIAQLQQFPFLNNVPSNQLNAKYSQNGEYTTAFKSEQVGHWTSQALISNYCDRGVPAPEASVMAGAGIE